MKNRLFMTLIVTLIVSILIVPTVYASECLGTYASKESVVYLSDGSYIVTTINEWENIPSLFSSTQTKTGSKTSAVYSATGSTLYSLTVHGTFSYNGSSASAKSSSYTYSDESPLWNFFSASSYCSGATATASGTFKSATQTKTISASLTCSANGSLS